LATKGKDAHKLVKKHNVRSLIESKRTKHSQKPPEIKERIVELMGDLPRIELFAREKTEGWDVWGNEVESDVNLLRGTNI
jgi:site-specific DNA-methyltransferase (adenine-specific)